MSAKYTFLAWDTPIENAPLKLVFISVYDTITSLNDKKEPA